MTSTTATTAEEDEIFIKSLYHFVKEKDTTVGKKESFHRLTVASKLPPNKTLAGRSSVAAFCEKFMERFTDLDKVTGLLLLYPNHALHIIESTTVGLVEVIKMLNQMENNEAEDTDVMFSMNRIICFSRCIGQHIYMQYSTKILDMEPANVQLFETTDPEHKVVSDVMNQVTRLSAFLYKEPMKDHRDYVPEIFAVKLAKILEKLRDLVPDLIPQQVIIGHLAEISQDSCLVSTDEFLHYYDRPYAVMLDSDVVWPAQRNDFLFS